MQNIVLKPEEKQALLNQYKQLQVEFPEGQCDEELNEFASYCDNCLDGDNYEVNVLIICELCGSMIHQSCWGSELVNKEENYIQSMNDWYCSRCQELIGHYLKTKQFLPYDEIRCYFCPELKGCIKKFNSPNKDIFAHTICIYWIYGQYFDDERFQKLPCLKDEEISIDKCYICKIQYGFTIKCSKKSCNNVFHITCAVRRGIIRHSKYHPPVKSNAQHIDVYCQSHIQHYSGTDEEKVSYKKAAEQQTKVQEMYSKNLSLISNPKVTNQLKRPSKQDASKSKSGLLEKGSKKKSVKIEEKIEQYLLNLDFRMKYDETETKKMETDLTIKKYKLIQGWDTLLSLQSIPYPENFLKTHIAYYFVQKGCLNLNQNKIIINLDQNFELAEKFTKNKLPLTFLVDEFYYYFKTQFMQQSF